MSGIKTPPSRSSKRFMVHRKPTGEEEWAYAHNPYDDSASGADMTPQSLQNPCRHYAEGRCNRGSACRFYHDTRHNVIVTPHSTPKQRAITPLTVSGLSSLPTCTASLTSPSRWSLFHASPVAVNATNTTAVPTVRRQSTGSGAEVGRAPGCTPKLSASNVSTPHCEGGESNDSFVMTLVQHGDVMPQADMDTTPSQCLSQQ